MQKENNVSREFMSVLAKTIKAHVGHSTVGSWEVILG
jgi:hypothetical protein